MTNTLQTIQQLQVSLKSASNEARAYEAELNRQLVVYGKEVMSAIGVRFNHIYRVTPSSAMASYTRNSDPILFKPKRLNVYITAGRGDDHVVVTLIGSNLVEHGDVVVGVNTAYRVQIEPDRPEIDEVTMTLARREKP